MEKKINIPVSHNQEFDPMSPVSQWPEEVQNQFSRFSVEVAADEVFWMRDDSNIIYVNDSACSRLGYSREELLQMYVWDWDPLFSKEVWESFFREIKEKKSMFFETKHCTKTGIIFPVEISAHVLECNGKWFLFAFVKDISERRKIEDELANHRNNLEELVKQRTEELERKNKEMETFTYSVSHDLKAPLRGIDGYSKLIEEEYGDTLDEDGKLFLKNVRNSATQMNQLIEDLLAYSRMERRDLQPVRIDLHSLVDNLLSQRKLDLEEHHIKVLVHLPYHTIRSDTETIRQVLTNFIDNAIKFARPDTNMTIEINGHEDDTSWTLWVKDNGIGFAPKYSDRIFEIFQRLHLAEDFPGTGIGLAIVKKGVERIGGRCWAESSLGEGATFSIKIPKSI